MITDKDIIHFVVDCAMLPHTDDVRDCIDLDKTVIGVRKVIQHEIQELKKHMQAQDERIIELANTVKRRNMVGVPVPGNQVRL